MALPLLASCSARPAPRDAFDAAEHLRRLYAERLGPAEAVDAEIPFALRGELLAAVEADLPRGGGVARRAARLVEWIFGDLGLDYARHPTRDALGTFRARAGNCLSFVNLFVGVGRHLGLAPFYVEVRDLGRWERRDGLVLGHGHVVAGLYVEGELRTFDFLPYRARTYRGLEILDDARAAARFFNNRGAEALLAGDAGEARRLFERAAALDPAFVEAANNLGVWHVRHGDAREAERIFRGALERAAGPPDPETNGEPDGPSHDDALLPLLGNLERLLRRQGRTAEADALLARAESLRHRNPFVHLVRAELALERDETGAAFEALRRALALAPELPEAHLGLARVHLALGRPAAARRHLDRALELDPRHPEALEMARMLEPAQ